MANYFTTLLSKLDAWREAKVQRSKQPLSRENAYILASLGSEHGNYSAIADSYHKSVLKSILGAARLGNTYLLQKHPAYVSPSDKKELVQFLTNLGYSVCYSNNDVVLISWRFRPEEFTQNTQ